MPDLALGLMSGTSCDGISAALVRFDRRKLRVLAHRTTPYASAFARRLLQAPTLAAREMSSLNMELGERFAQAALALLKTSRVSPRRIAVIGSHGHTVYHGPRDPHPSTLQIGESAVIAERTGISVVADFRPRDIAAGGEGAPLVPAFDQAFFGGGPARALLNIGGIANVTVVGRGIRPLAFDAGPGNCLIDLAIQSAFKSRLRCDAGGQLAARGRIDHAAIRRWWSHPYFRRNPPKSTGRELFDAAFIRLAWRRLPPLPDRLATLTFFTAYSVAYGLMRWLTTPLREAIISGGGVYNRTLMAHLSRLLEPALVRSIASYGIPPLAKEPAAFAWLALRAVRGETNHLPKTTGARHARVLGCLIRRI
jgi:anhydro-N-acetylmuramic acid kinase